LDSVKVCLTKSPKKKDRKPTD